MNNQHILADLLLKKADCTSTPIDGVFELTPICNMSCKMCYVRKSKQEVQAQGGLKSVSEWLSLAKEAQEQGLLFLLLTGGEILTYPDFEILYLELTKMGFVLSLNTNGTLITEKQADFLSQYPPRCINITLYGSSEETYEKLCGNGKVFTKVLNNIKLLKSKGLNIKINASLTPLNINDLNGIYQFVNENNLHMEATAYMFPPARRENAKDFIRFSAEDTAKYTRCFHCLSKTDAELTLQKDAYLQSLKPDHSLEEDFFLHMRCRGGLSSFWITWDGRLTPCGMMTEPCGFPFKEGFSQAWNSVSKQTKQILLSSKCAKCANRRVCSVCAAKAMAETGRYDGTPEYLCAVTNEMNKIMLQES